MRARAAWASAGLVGLLACAEAPVPVEEVAAEVATSNEAAESASACMKGCAVEPPPPPDTAEIEDLLRQVGEAEVGEASPAIETLLFHAEAVRDFVAVRGTDLPPEHDRFVRRELARTHVWVAMRVVDEKGVTRARVDETRVPIGDKRHLKFAHYVDVQPFETNGTPVRVGLGHIWSRY